MKTTTTVLSLAALLFGASILNAATKEYDFKDPKGVNNVSFQLDAPLESISGNAKGVSGVIRFDPDAPESISGVIIIEAASLTVTNNKMQDHMLGAGWLDVANHPEIRFTAKAITEVEARKDGYAAHVTGDFSLKGVTQEMTVPVLFTYLPDMLSARSNGALEGDLLVLRATFTINRSEFGIKPGKSTNKVAEAIELRLAIAGAAPDA